MTTIRDVAKFASVSPTTVSQVLRNRRAVHPRTRQVVQQAIEQLGYRRRGVGRPAKRPRHLSVGIAYKYIPGEVVQTSATWNWFDAIQRQLQRAGYHVNFFGGPHERAGDDPMFQSMVLKGRLHGLIVVGGYGRVQDGIWASQHGVPLVVVHRRPDAHPFSYVDLNNNGGAQQAVDYLVRHGHQRIVMLQRHGGTDGHDAAERRQGFEQAMRRHGLNPVAIHIEPSGETQDVAACRSLCRRLLESGTSAVFCDNDGVALRLMHHCHALKIAVPQQLAIVGFDALGRPSSQGLRVTSVGINIQLLAQSTVDMLDRLVQNKNDLCCISTVLQTHIVEYDTVITSSRQTDALAAVCH